MEQTFEGLKRIITDPDSKVHRIEGYVASRQEEVNDEFEARMMEARNAGAPDGFMSKIKEWRTGWNHLRMGLEPGDPGNRDRDGGRIPSYL